MARRVFRVVPSGSDWQVKEGDVSYGTHANKEVAVQVAVNLAKLNQPSQVMVHRGDGTFEYEYTYGDDPERYPG